MQDLTFAKPLVPVVVGLCMMPTRPFHILGLLHFLEQSKQKLP